MIDYKKYLTKNFWNKLAADFVIKVTDDARAGIMQDGKTNIPYRSEEYKRYKAENMRRRTLGEANKKTYTFDRAGDFRWKPLYFNNLKADNRYSTKTRKQKGSKGDRLKAYQGRQIVNDDVSKVNMELTGETFRNYMNGIKVYPDSTGVAISYAPQDADKVLGNQALGRQIVGANQKNTEWIFDQIEEALMKPVSDEWKKDINITIG
jgi:hypothetical protein